jgi:acyl-CoA synthetase (AMP-forming)/AMP-acid ligase II
MSMELYAIMVALLHAGLVPVFAEPAVWHRIMGQGVPGIALRAFIGVPAACALRLLVPALRAIPSAFVAGTWFPGTTSLHAANHVNPSSRSAWRDGSETALITFTSGTTGAPKGVLRSHTLLLATHHILRSHLQLAPGTVQVSILPIFVFTNLGAGAASLIPDADLSRPGAIDARRLLQQIARWQPAGMVVSPSLADHLAQAALRDGGLASLRRVLIGGAPVFPELLDRFAQAAPNARIFAIYGASEAEPMAVLDRESITESDRQAIRGGSGLLAGRPIPEISLRIVRPVVGDSSARRNASDLDAIALGPGESGEIIVSGENVSPGYLGGQADRDTKIDVAGTRWHRTGDTGRLDGQGRLWLLGPASAAFLGTHGRSNPLAVDAALSGHRDVARATLMRESERTLLVIEPRRHLGPDSAAAIAGLVPWSGADEVILVDHLPMDRRHNAKIDHRALRDMLRDRRWQLRTPVARSAASGVD